MSETIVHDYCRPFLFEHLAIRGAFVQLHAAWQQIALLWGERQLRSVANHTRRDGREFLAIAPKVPVHTRIETFPLTAANAALARLRAGQLTGAAVLIP